MPDLGKYAIVYTAFSAGGPCVSLALTTDFTSFERYGDISFSGRQRRGLCAERSAITVALFIARSAW